LAITVKFTARQLFRTAENIEHGPLNAAMQRSAITRNNVGRVAQQQASGRTDRAPIAAAARNEEKY